MERIDAMDGSGEHGRMRRRALGLAVAAALAAGPLIGFELGQRLGDSDRVSVASDPATSDGTLQEDEAGDGDIAESSPSPGMPVDDGGDFATDSSPGYGYGHGPDLDRVGSLTVNGVDIRLFRSTFDQPNTGNPLWDPPAGCFPTGSLMAQVSTPGMVAIVGTELYGLQPTEGVIHLVGVAEQDPHWVVVGSTDAAVVTVRLPDGGSVDAPVTDGVFSVAATAPEADHEHAPRATAVVEGQEIGLGQWTGPIDERFHENCEPPPPALPPAGEQPEDPDAARVEIAEAYASAYGGGQGGPSQLDAFADPEAMASVLEDLGASEAFDSYRGKVSAVVGEIVFDSPTHAWLFYDIDPVLTGRIGEAVLTDRGWKVANETMCADVSLVGVACG